MMTTSQRHRIPGYGAHSSKRPASEEKWVPTVCSMCYNHCSIQVLVRDGVATAIEGLPGAPPNHGKMCAKGKSALSGLYSPSRVTRPLKRTNPDKGIGVDPKWEEISWEEALEIITNQLKTLHQRNPRGLSGSSFDTANSEILSPFITAFGGDSGTTIPQSSGLFCGNGVHPVAYMMNGSQDHHPDVESCQYMLVLGGGFGTGTGTHAMHLAQQLAEARVKRGLKMVVLDPCRTSSGARADEWIPTLPGTDSAFCLAVVNVLINELGIYDQEFLAKYTNATYLIRPNGHYARDPEADKPLVLSRSKEMPVPYDHTDPNDMVLEGETEVNGERVNTAFSLLKTHLQSYTPEYASQITTVPASTIRRIAREFGTAARIGATTVVDGVELPLRPACAVWYRGIGQHQHGLHQGWAAAMLNITVGAVDVPGGYCHLAATGPWGIPKAGPDGLLNVTNPFLGVMKKSLPVKKVEFDPDDPDLTGMFPVAPYSRTMGGLTLNHPDKYKIEYKVEFWIHARVNPMKSAGDPVHTAEILKRIPFQLSFVQQHEETSEFADIILPDTHYLERLAPFAHNPYRSFITAPSPGDKEWVFATQQPVIQPIGEARSWPQVLWELAHRADFADDFYSALNALVELGPDHRLVPGQHYSYQEFCDRWMRAWTGDEHGLEYYKNHGWATSPLKREVKHRYPRIFHTGRIPLYLEHWLTGGEAVRAVVDETGIEWGDLSDYEPLVNYRPCWASQEGGDEFPLYLVSPKVGFLTLNTSTIKNPHLQELAWSMGEIFNVGIHPSVAERYGIGDGDTVEIESANGKMVTAKVRITRDVHPRVVSAPGNVSKVLSPDEKQEIGHGVHLNAMLPYRKERIDMVSAALDSCVKIRIQKVRNGSRQFGLLTALKSFGNLRN